MIERRWASSSARETATAFSASKVRLKGQMRTLVPGGEHGRLAAQHLFVAHDATVQADVLQLQLAVDAAHHGVLPRDQRALQADGVRRVAADGHHRLGHLDHVAAALVDFVEPDLHRCCDFLRLWSITPTLRKFVSYETVPQFLGAIVHAIVFKFDEDAHNARLLPQHAPP